MGKLAFALAVPIALLATVASMGIIVVDVREGGGQRVVVPVPLVVAQAAVAIARGVAREKMQIPDTEALRHIGVAREVLQALAAGPDGELVRVEQRDQNVLITKQGRALHVRVSSPRENVSVNVPFALALEALPDANGRISGLTLAASLGSVRFTDLVRVHDGKDDVRISVW